MKLILLSLSLLGLGAIGGYITFHLMLSSRCSHLLVETESRHKLALKELQGKNQKLAEDYGKCMHDEGTKQQLLELQGRLEAQSVLADRHQELVAKHETMQRDLQQLNEEKTYHIQVIEEHRVSVEDLQNKLQAHQQESGELAVAREELEQVRSRFGVVQEDMELFRSRLEACENDRLRTQEEANELRTVLNEREEVLRQVNERLEQMEVEFRRRQEEDEYRHRQEEEEQQHRREEEEEEYRRRVAEEEEENRRAQEEGREEHYEPEQHHEYHEGGEEL